MPIVEEGTDFEHEMSHLPFDLRTIVSKKNALPLPHYFFDAAIEILHTRFLKISENIRVIETPSSEKFEVDRVKSILNNSENTTRAFRQMEDFLFISYASGYGKDIATQTNE